MSWLPWLGKVGLSKTPDVDVTEKRVNEALRRWRGAVIPLDPQVGADGRRARASATIAAAMRQAQLERTGEKRRHRWGLAAAAVLVLGLGGLAYAALPRAESTSIASVTDASLTEHRGTVLVGGAGVTALEPLTHGPRLLEVGGRVVTGEHARVGLQIGEDTAVRLQAQSELVLVRNDTSQKLLALKSGSIEVAVTPAEAGKQRRTVIVDTPDARVQVHGTKFAVTVDEEGGVSHTNVKVAHGVVAVLQGGVEQVRLRAGESWFSTPPTPATRPKSSQSLLPPSPEAQTSKPRRVAVRPLLPPTKVSEQPTLDSTSTLQQENALFRKALTLRNNGNDAGAVRAFNDLLAKYPQSTLVQEARVERFRALKRLGRDRDAAREARRYLIDHGNGFATDEARDVALTQ